MSETDTRTLSLVDLPLVRRLGDKGTILHSELGLTRDARGPNSALLSSILFTRGLYTLVARSDKQHVVGQFRYRTDDLNAHIVYLAPRLEDGGHDSVWLHILDAMAREAGKHGAHTLIGEVEQSSHLFETMRTAGFAVYTRQTIWRHDPAPSRGGMHDIALREETPADQIDIHRLMCHLMPTLLQAVAMPPSDMNGLVYRQEGQEGRLMAYIAYSEGTRGIYILPYLHPDLMPKAADLLLAAITRMHRAHKRPLYVSIRSYQPWMETIMADLGFEAWIEQAIMVKHLTARTRHPHFTPVRVLAGSLETATSAQWTPACTVPADDPPEELV